MISEFPLLVFSVIAGAAAGAYALSPFLFVKKRSGEPNAAVPKDRSWLFPLLCLLLLGVGLLFSLSHLEHPERFLNAMWNPLSRITEEAYWSMAFGVVLVIDFILSLARKSGTPRFLRWIGAVCGLGVMVATGLAYALNYGIPAWRGVFTFPLFLVGDIAMGCALYAVFFKVVSRKSYACAATIVYILYAVVLIGVGAQFSGAGQSMVAFIVALVIAGAVGVFCALYGLRAKGSFAKALPWIALVCVVAGTVVARYAFYAACTF